MKHIFIYITTPSEEEAHRIAQALVSERLAACANIMTGMTSIYQWQGQMEQGQECVVIAKTREDLFAAVETRVCELHSYETPCIVSLPVTAGHAPFLNWITAETRP